MGFKKFLKIMLIVPIHAFGVLMGFNCHDNGSYFWASQAGHTIIYLKMDLLYLRVTTVVYFITLRYNNKLKKDSSLLWPVQSYV